jgi:hypothetical protein
LANFNYDAVGNIEQTITTSAIGFNQGIGVVVSPLTNAAVQPNVAPTGAPNSFSTTTDRGAGAKTAAFSVNNVVAGVIVSVVTNPA